jgi:glutaredoxin
MQPRIVFYSSPTSAYCEEMRQLLQEQQLQFEEKSVEDSQAALEVRRLVGDEVVPVTVLYGEQDAPYVVVGHDRQRLLNILEAL